MIAAALFALTLCTDAAAFDHSHARWGTVLSKFVSGPEQATTVDYEALKRSPRDLEQYLGELTAVSAQEYEAWSEGLRLAFLINAYNAFTLKLVVDHYPIGSIRELGALFSSAWKREFFSLLGARRHLDWIEHATLRRRFAEPRIHFALSCASKGCPALRRRPYLGERIDAELEESALLFLKDASRNRYDAKKKTLWLSETFKWYGRDFEKHAGSVRDFVARRLAATEEDRKAIASKATAIEYLDCDWKLNSTSQDKLNQDQKEQGK